MTKKVMLVCFFVILFFSSCKFFYEVFYSDFKIHLFNDTQENIVEVLIYLDSSVKKTDLEPIIPLESRNYSVGERKRYIIFGLLSDDSTFQEYANFSDLEEITIRVK